MDRVEMSYRSVAASLVAGLLLYVAALGACSSPSGTSVDAGACSSPSAMCGAVCSDLSSDNANCGACGSPCALGTSCVRGACTASCGSGLTSCGSGATASCVDVKVDPANCGACDKHCGTGVACVSGACSASCPSGQSVCGDGSAACTSLADDPANCGTCGHACGAGVACIAGTCSAGCPAGQSQCGDASGTCTNLANDPANCGTCGHACGAGIPCVASTCGAPCPSGQTLCGDASATCSTTDTDSANCGMCGHACPQGEVCSGGTCGVSCQAGTLLCAEHLGYDAGPGPVDASNDTSVDAGPPVCVNPKVDNRNCGSCGKTCGDSQSCTGGTCTYATSCRDLLVKRGPLPDGTYTIDPDGATGPITPFAIYCYNMSTGTPTEYLNLVNTEASGFPMSNYSSNPGGGACNSPCVTQPFTRWWTKVRFDVTTLTIVQTDLTFSFLESPSVSACWMMQLGTCSAYLNGLYAIAEDCTSGVLATASVDLTGTGFSIAPSVTTTTMGDPAGGALFNAGRTTLTLSGGGGCGQTALNGPLLLQQN